MAADDAGWTKVTPVWSQPGKPLPEPFSLTGDFPPPAPLPLTGTEIFTVYVDDIPRTTSVGDLANFGVSSFNGRTGAVDLTIADITAAGGAPIYSPSFLGDPLAPTQPAGDSSSSIATTEFVTSAVDATFQDFLPITGGTLAGPGNLTVNGLMTAASGYFVAAGTPGSNNGLVIQVNNLSRWTVYSDNTNELGNNTGSNFAISAYSDAGSPLYSPITISRASGLVTMATGLTVTGGLSSTNLSLFSGNVQFSGASTTAPTRTAGDSTTNVATTAFVTNAINSLAPGGVSSFNGRTGAITLTTGDITGAGGATAAQLAGYLPLAGGTVTGPTNFNAVITGPTAAPGTSTTQLASTAFVTAAIAAIPAGGVTSFNGRQGAITLTLSDVTSAGGAPLSGPIFTNNPRGPTPAPGDNSTSLATTAFVDAAIAALPPSSAGATISATPPANPSPGNLWFDSVGLQTYIWYNDPTSSQWVPVINDASGSGGGGGGLADAPSDGNLYGRENATWTVVPPVSGVYLPLAGGTLTGSLSIAPAANNIPTFVLNATPAGNGRTIAYQTSGVMRWAIVVDGSAESGSNAGSNFVINRYADAGGPAIDSPLTINRATGNATFSGSVTVNNSNLNINASYPQINLNRTDTNNQAGIFSRVNNNLRWGLILGDTAAETGSNAGSNLDLWSYTDSGAGLLPVITINRATGTLVFNGTNFNYTSNQPYVVLNKTVNGNANYVIGTTNNSDRWHLVLGDWASESGSNAGSNFTLQSFSDTGAFLATPFTINRATGNAIFSGDIQSNQHIYGNAVAGQSPAGSGFCVYGFYQSGVYFNSEKAGCNVNGTQAVLFYNNNANNMVWSTAQSDRRRKSNFKPAGNALDIVKRLPVYDLDYNAGIKSTLRGDRSKGEDWMPDSETEHWPFSLIADEVAAIMPHAAIKNKEDDGEHWIALHPTHLVATLWKAVQQLTDKLDTVTAELDTLKAQIGAPNAAV